MVVISVQLRCLVKLSVKPIVTRPRKGALLVVRGNRFKVVIGDCPQWRLSKTDPAKQVFVHLLIIDGYRTFQGAS